MVQVLLALHIFANTIWIGAILSVGWLLVSSERAEGERADTLASAAAGLYRKVASPAFGISFLAGLGRLLDAPAAYMSLHWFHGKLTAALAVIALHHVIGARAKRAAAAASGRSGSRQARNNSAILTGATLACALLTVMFAVLKGQLVP